MKDVFTVQLGHFSMVSSSQSELIRDNGEDIKHVLH
uniref:Uncharacterized protein n=1 Tax=Anguilla anguilla TaxID=7936 RepID=A0A0E9SS71_ANGAN